ncbi:MAG: XRE family transcriptional regulator [Desulfitobacteriaceae bacterium]|nr:XRE family transcriptional regulator [Desulfitobacteriaceae bacterium]
MLKEQRNCCMDIGSRIKMARISAQMSMRDLAEKVGVSHTAISKYERNIDRPRPAILLKLARVLNVDAAYFLQDTPFELQCTAYRKQKKLSQKQQKSIETKITSILEKQLEFESALPNHYATVFELQTYDVASFEDVEQAAEALRDYFEIGYDSIENLTETIEQNGIRVVAMDAPQGFDGFSCWVNGDIPVIVSQTNIPGDRQRYNLAHELGHLLLNTTNGFDAEKAAHRFAGALLLPRKTALREFGPKRSSLNMKELYILKHKYGISMQAIAKRAFELEIISDEAYKKLYIQFSKNGWRKEEAGTPYPVEQSYRFMLLVQQALAENLINPSKAAELLGQRPPANTQAYDYSFDDLEYIANQYRYDKELTTFSECAEDVLDYE